MASLPTRTAVIAALSEAGWRMDSDEPDRIEASGDSGLSLAVYFEEGIPTTLSYGDGERRVRHETEFPGLDALSLLTPAEVAARLRLFENPLFDTGVVTATPAALAALGVAEVAPSELIARHVSGDWGEVPDEDAAENKRSIRGGLRVLSAYALPTGKRVWIITESDRSSTCILLPEDY